MNSICFECGKKFDLTDTKQRDDFFFGHDCETMSDPNATMTTHQ